MSPPPDGLTAARALAVALGIGLLVGLERERRKGAGRDRGPAGIRTFALASVLGGLSLLLPHPAAFAIAGVFVAAISVVGYLRTRGPDPGITTEIALVVTFLLGALAVEQPVLASGLAAAVTVLLAARDFLHRFVRHVLSENELHDALVFAAAALVVLPLLPNRGLGPWNALNPQLLWRLVVLVMAISGLGYVAVRSLGARFGLPVAGFAGGFVSSTATIGTMGARARNEPALCNAAVAGAVWSTVATVVEMAIVLSALSPDLARGMLLPLALAGLAALAYGAIAAWRNERPVAKDKAAPGRAFDLKVAVLFALTVSAILVASTALHVRFGGGGLFVASALAGLADAHAAAISAASLVAAGRLAPEQAVLPVLAGLTTNTASKMVVAVSTGGWTFARRTVPGLLLVTLASWLGWWLGAR